MEIYELTKPIGIASYVFLALAVLTGLLKTKFHIKWITIKLHIYCGILALIFATLHVLIIIYVNM